MARILGLFPAALIAAKNDMSANAFYRELQGLGMAARRAEVLQLYGIARNIVARSPDEPFQDISRVPVKSELPAWPVKTSEGIMQTVSLTYRDKTTGKISRTYWSIKTDEGITREEAMSAAIDAYSEHAEAYGQDLIGAVHTSAYALTPLGS